MNSILSVLLSRASRLADVEPVLALFLAGALLAVFFTVLLQPVTLPHAGAGVSLLWRLYGHATRLIRAVVIVALLVMTITVLRNYLRQTALNFQRSHGRVTQANYNAVQTIWGAEQAQGELRLDIYNNQEITERIESEDLTRPAILRKRTVRNYASGNPFVAAHHEVTVTQNPRKKGSAYYDGYETDCRFSWKLKNPADAPFHCDLIFPLPDSSAMYDELSATLNGEDVLPRVEIKNGTLTLSRNLQPNEAMDFRIAFKSRGMSYWYFQVREAREIRDFTLTLNLPDLAKTDLDYPYNCMTPTAIGAASNNVGCVLTYRLDHALSSKGMGVSLPKQPQPGATTNAVLAQVETAWLLNFALLAFAFTLTPVRFGFVYVIILATATAFGYGLVGDLSDFLFGFWGTAALIMLPIFLLLAGLVRRTIRGGAGNWLAVQMIGFGIGYPILSGLLDDRELLFLNLCAVALLSFVSWLLVRRLSQGDFASPAVEAAARAT